MSRSLSSEEDNRPSDHGADGIQIRIESNSLPLHGLGVGVVHGVLKGSLPVVVFVDRAARVLCFWCGSVDKKNKISVMK